jgi:hypothetical protein
VSDRYAPFSSLKFERPEPGVLRVILSAPGRLNAVGAEGDRDLANVWLEIDRDPDGLNDLLRVAAKQDSQDFYLDVLRGMSDALRGRRKATPPPAWAAFEKVCSTSRPGVKDTARELSVVFGDGRALDELWQTAQSSQADPDARRAAGDAGRDREISTRGPVEAEGGELRAEG